MSAGVMRPGNLLSGFQGGQRGVVVRLFGDFIHQLAVDDLIIFIDNDHGASGQASQRTGGDGAGYLPLCATAIKKPPQSGG